jgi:hypothetical protein
MYEVITFTVDYPEAVTEPPMSDNEKYIAALLREREAAPRLGAPERVAEIDAELERHGFGPDGKPLKRKQGEAPPGRKESPERRNTARRAAG